MALVRAQPRCVAAFALAPAALPATAPRVRGAAAVTRETPRCFNRRSEAARRRWQDPAYRAKMRAARGASALVAPRSWSRQNARKDDHQSSDDRYKRPDPLADEHDELTEMEQHDEGNIDDDDSRSERAQNERDVQDMLEDAAGLLSSVLRIGVGDSITACDEQKAAAINLYVRRNKLRSEKLIMFHHDKQRWMDHKLRQGEDRRLLIDNDELKRQRQLERQEEARKRHARIRARKAQQVTDQ